ncbi:MAG: GxxExxY protein [Lewinellaceae bacterium]|nr:GxxExxY protein [Lewinellaceae bacterium]MCB9332791.1 GxxExxY protein [Lewinellaceae bacterium]
MTENEITEKILTCAFRVHTTLGPGLLENAYEACLEHELHKSNLPLTRQQALPLVYETVKLETGYRLDLFVAEKVIVEIKAVEELNQLHMAQLLTYLRLTGCKVGLLLNFNTVSLKQGIKRLVNNY